MSTIKDSQAKKQLSYQRDHYNRNGESNKAWRKTKPLKKSKARRAYRKKANDLAKTCADEDTAPLAALRRQAGHRQRKVQDWGAISLRALVKDRLTRRVTTRGARQQRQAGLSRPDITLSQGLA